MSGTIVTRFAPSPTGPLHLGHAYAAHVAHGRARAAGGRFLLRIEDIDGSRARPEHEAAILDDLRWLGLGWDGAARRQSEHMDAYAGALDRLRADGLLYPCFCTRAEIRAEIASADAAPHGPEGPRYPGTCRGLDASSAAARIADGAGYALRLDMTRAVARARAVARTGTDAAPLTWHDETRGTVVAVPERFGDIVLARKETPTSYHLAVTLDDHLQGVTLVTRGTDLLETTDIHRLLQALLGLDVPAYAHHRLLTDRAGRRFAKRDKGLTLRALRETGRTRQAVIMALDAPDPLTALGL